MTEITNVSGTEIVGVHNHYENLGIRLSDDRYVYMTYEQLLVILNEFDFELRKKRTRSWMEIQIDDWRVERFDEPRSY